MLTHPMAERLRGLGMAAMADAFLEMQSNATAADLLREDWLGLLLDREVTARDNKRLGRRLRQARLRQNAVVEDTDFRTSRGLDRALFHKLSGCDWIRHTQHLVIGGPTGTGKSWLACALGHKACREGFSVLYRRRLYLTRTIECVIRLWLNIICSRECRYRFEFADRSFDCSDLAQSESRFLYTRFRLPGDREVDQADREVDAALAELFG